LIVAIVAWPPLDDAYQHQNDDGDGEDGDA
jgi:hypothetical protein